MKNKICLILILCLVILYSRTLEEVKASGELLYTYLPVFSESHPMDQELEKNVYLQLLSYYASELKVEVKAVPAIYSGKELKKNFSLLLNGKVDVIIDASSNPYWTANPIFPIYLFPTRDVLVYHRKSKVDDLVSLYNFKSVSRRDSPEEKVFSAINSLTGAPLQFRTVADLQTGLEMLQNESIQYFVLPTEIAQWLSEDERDFRLNDDIFEKITPPRQTAFLLNSRDATLTAHMSQVFASTRTKGFILDTVKENLEISDRALMQMNTVVQRQNQTLFQLAQNYFRNGRFEEAMNACINLIFNKYNVFEVERLYYDILIAYMNKNAEQADLIKIEYFSEFLQYAQSEPLKNKALEEWDQDILKKLERFFFDLQTRAANEGDPLKSYNLSQLKIVQRAENNLTDSEKQLAKEESLSRTIDERSLRIITSLVERGAYQQALILIDRYANRYPDDEQLADLKQQVSFLYGQEQLKRHIADYRDSIERAIRREQYKEAQEDINHLLLLSPENDWAKSKQEELTSILEEARVERQNQIFVESTLETAENLFLANKFQDALNAFQQVLNIFPNNKTALEGVEKSQQSLETKRRRELERRVAQYLEQGIIAYHAENYQQSINYLNNALEIVPDNTIANEYLELATTAFQIQQEENVSPLNPYYNIFNRNNSRAIKALNDEDYSKALQIYNKILFLFPQNRSAQIGSLKAYRFINPEIYNETMSSKYEEIQNLLKESPVRAQRKIEILIDIDSDYRDIRSIYKQLTQPPSSLSDAQVKRMYQAALEAYNRGDIEKAVGLWEEIVEKKPNEVNAKVLLARVSAQRDFSGQAISSGQQSRNTKDQLAQSHYDRGMVFYNQNNYSQALEEWRKVLKINPYDKKTLNNIRRVERLLDSQ